jgi:hypothetical protein
MPYDGLQKIVRAEFTPGGKQYHYLAAAQIGDTIQAPDNSPATVVGFGRQGYDGPVREAKVIATPEGSISRAIRHEMAGLQATIPIKRGESIRARKVKRVAKERAAHRQLAIDTLATIAADHLAPSAARVAAAVELLKATS